MEMVLRRCTLVLLSSCLLLAGCDGEREVDRSALESMAGGKLEETTPVSGTVLVGGLPVGGVNIYAYAADKPGAPVSQVRTTDDGKYCWTTYEICDGLPPGEYKLAFAYIPHEGKGKKAGEDLFKGKYRNPSKSEHTLKVTGGAPQTDVNYEFDIDI